MRIIFLIAMLLASAASFALGEPSYGGAAIVVAIGVLFLIRPKAHRAYAHTPARKRRNSFYEFLLFF